jgi:hypothetical protein
MKSLAKRMVTVVGGLALAAFLLALAAPKAAHAIVSTLVTVSNTAANPVPTRATDNPARQAVLLAVAVEMSDGQGSGIEPLFTDSGQFTVPAGQCLVVDSVSGHLTLPAGQTPNQLAVFGFSSSRAQIYPVATFQGSSPGFSYFSFATPVTTYMEAGSQPQAFCSRGPSSSGVATCTFYVAGHLESVQ